MKIVNNIVNYNKSESIGNKLRQRRFNFFLYQIKHLKKPIRILDIGGTESFWVNRGFANNKDYEITLINLRIEDVKSSNIASEIGDATDLSKYNDKEFDVVFSNSVIEHLYTKENQKKMANEVMRLGKNYFIQTPNRFFPIEPHFLFPMFQFLPRKLKIFLLTKTKIVRGKKYELDYAENRINEIKLLDKSELMKLFTPAKIYKEKFFGLNKSFIAYKFKKN